MRRVTGVEVGGIVRAGVGGVSSCLFFWLWKEEEGWGGTSGFIRICGFGDGDDDVSGVVLFKLE